MVGFRI